MLKDVLKQFNLQQTGSKTIQLPTGEYIDLTVSSQRKELTSWLTSLFGSEEQAEDQFNKLSPLALSKEKPWPYIIKALFNISENKKSMLTNKSIAELKDEFVSKIGKARLRLLNSIAAHSIDKSFVIDGVKFCLTYEADRASLLQRLLDSPVETYLALSPQYKYFLTSTTHFGNLLVNMGRIKLAASGSYDREMVLHTLNRFKMQAVPQSEMRELFKLLVKFYEHANHGYLFTFFNPATRTNVELNQNNLNQLEDLLVRVLESNMSYDVLLTEWVDKAIKYGIITNPLNWLVTVLMTKSDPTEEYRDWDWYDEDAMVSRYGLIKSGDGISKDLYV